MWDVLYSPHFLSFANINNIQPFPQSMFYRCVNKIQFGYVQCRHTKTIKEQYELLYPTLRDNKLKAVIM